MVQHIGVGLGWFGFGISQNIKLMGFVISGDYSFKITRLGSILLYL